MVWEWSLDFVFVYNIQLLKKLPFKDLFLLKYILNLISYFLDRTEGEIKQSTFCLNLAWLELLSNNLLLHLFWYYISLFHWLESNFWGINFHGSQKYSVLVCWTLEHKEVCILWTVSTSVKCKQNQRQITKWSVGNSILSHDLRRSLGQHRWLCNNPFPLSPVFSCRK